LKGLTSARAFYNDSDITRADLFHYVYALLHHPAYRLRYRENLKRDLPRIPFVGVVATGKDAVPASFFPLSAIIAKQNGPKSRHNVKGSTKLFHAFADAGKKLADLHINYESAKEFSLVRLENKDAKLDWRVEAMRLSKDKKALFYNDFLTLSGIPTEVYDYRLGNRSALEWVIDQYRVVRDEKGNITSDPNRLDDEQYILRLVGKVISVSLETIKVISGLPSIQSVPSGRSEAL
jgi:predicted helicase